MLTAITRTPSPAIANCELTFVAREPIDFERAKLQHQQYCAAMAACGVQVVTLPAEDELADSVFVEDAAVVFDEIAVITLLGADSRRPEAALVERELARFRTTVHLSAPATLEGGDVLRVGKKVYVGLSRRTNEAGVDQLRKILAPLGYAVIAVPVSGCLHLKTGCTALDDHTLLAHPDWVDLKPFSNYMILPVSPREPWAANVLRVGSSLIASETFPETRARVEGRGYRVYPVDLSEFAKAEGGPTCLSLLFESP